MELPSDRPNGPYAPNANGDGKTKGGNGWGRQPMGKKKGRGYAHKYKVLALVDRTSGRAKSMVVDDLKANTLVRARFAPRSTPRFARRPRQRAAHDCHRHRRRS